MAGVNLAVDVGNDMGIQLLMRSERPAGDHWIPMLNCWDGHLYLHLKPPKQKKYDEICIIDVYLSCVLWLFGFPRIHQTLIQDDPRWSKMIQASE